MAEPQQHSRRLAAVLAADVANYSRMMGEDEDATLSAWWRHRREVIDPNIARHEGRIVKHTGDGFLAEFGSALEAVSCALEIQQTMAERNARVSNARRMEFRMGVNICDVTDDGEDIHGDGVNIAARLEGLAEPGGICISGDVYRQVRNKLHFGYQALGEQRVKNIAEPVVAYLIGPQGSFRRPRHAPPRPQAAEGETVPEPRPSERRRLTAILLCLIVGWFGGHRFYLGRRGTGFVQLLTIGGLGLWTLADLILLLSGELKDGDGRRLSWLGPD